MDKLYNEKCTGCGACAQVCPQKCIIMERDENGFLYPEADRSLCIQCNQCYRICHTHNDNKKTFRVKEAYACKNNDEKIRMESSSGGIFTLLAKVIIKNNGVVIGAALDKGFSVEHIAVENECELHRLRGSKYVQSRTDIIYPQCRDYLENGRIVLFTGTPCQIYGLKTFLGKDYENLITQDIVCHGVASPGVWNKYKKYREKESGSLIDSISFRSKISGWKSYSMLFEFKNGKTYRKPLSGDLFMRGYLANLFLRKSCYQCTSKGYERGSDITLADFWGIKFVIPGWDDNKGISLVLINSEKGKKIFESVKDKTECRKVDFEDAVKFNSAACKSSLLPKNRECFLSEIKNGDYKKVTKKHTTSQTKLKIKRIIRKLKSFIGK